MPWTNEDGAHLLGVLRDDGWMLNGVNPIR